MGKYLGIPILHKRVTYNTYNFLVDKVNQRLSNWKAKMLSMVGRVTLVKSVLQATPSYVMQTVAFPIHVCDAIDQKCRAFVWGDDDQHKMLHTVPRTEICD